MSRHSATRPPKEKVFDPHLISIASVTVMGSIMSILDTTIVNVALKTLVQSFHTSLASIQWVSTGYLLALATVIPLTRWIVDRFGTRRAWMTSATLFLMGSFLCGLSWSATSLIAFRVIQGLGGGMLMPLGQTIIAREAGPERLGRVMTVIGVPQLLGPILGPVVGGLILSTFSWRWIFFVNIPIGIVALYRARRILPKTDEDLSGAKRLDVVGMLLLSPGLASVVYALSEFGNVGRLTLNSVLGVVIGAVLVTSFVFHALRVPEPLLDLRLWKNRGFAMSTITGALFGSGMQAATFLIPLYFQIVRGSSPLRAALLMAPGGLGAMISMPNAGKVMDKVGARRIVPIGLTIFSLAVIPYTMITAHTNEALLSFFWFIRGVGSGCVFTPTMAAGYSTLSRTQIAAATTVNNIANRIGGSLGVAFAAVLLQRRIATALPNLGPSGFATLNAAQRAVDGPALAHSFSFVFFITVSAGVVALFPAFGLPAKRVRPQQPDDSSNDEVLPVEEGLDALVAD